MFRKKFYGYCGLKNCPCYREQITGVLRRDLESATRQRFLIKLGFWIDRSLESDLVMENDFKWPKTSWSLEI
jgi:hypothetical protein